MTTPSKTPSSTPATPAGTPGSGPTARPVDREQLDLLLAGGHGDPHSVLGAHPHAGGVTVRVLRPLASRVTVVGAWGETPLEHEHEGFWVGVLPVAEVPDYRVRVAYDGEPVEVDDPYRFLPTLGEVDLHLVNEGRHEQLWTVLGARVHHYEVPGSDETITGTSFAVWAPSARGVRIKGSFNSWDGREHPMRQLGSSGVWELFVPGLGTGTAYKYAILGQDGEWREKADPLAAWSEQPPATSSLVFESTHEWGDDAWMAERPGKQPVAEAMSVYEMHLASWKKHPDGRFWSWAELADELPAYLADLGFTHVELMPVMQHPFGGSWGYHVTSYFAPDARFGDPDGFKLLVDKLHQAGIGVILDWVPGHFATDEWALARFDGTPLYEDPNPQRGWHKEWGSHIFNFGRNEVRNFLYANAVYWLEEFHADGLRVDGVASMLYLDYSREEGEWTPNKHGGRENLEAVQFLQEMNATVYKRVPGIVTIAEESTSWPGVTRPTSADGLGFGFKWNMGWMHDSLGYVAHEPVHRAYHHGEMTFSLVYAWSENYVLPISHDEVVHGKGSLLRKMPGDRWQQLANLRAYLGFMWAHPGKQLLFMGAELGQESEWAESRELDWWLLDHPEHRGVHSLVRDLNRVYTGSPALWAADHDPAGFQWIDANDAGHNTFSFVRRVPDDAGAAAGTGAAAPELVCVANFSAVPHEGYRLALPSEGVWEEVLNTDAETYTGSGVGNLGAVTAVAGEHQGLPAHADIVVPPLATVWFRRKA
ncbi:1,4-alpha-glucan branching protein GlgB [Nocardioides abyssi]|uniref:1,4-alpha-glucan branching enzyme GlgB n=1 Tax=Nocardioides abyssi TaxID=3058370 RepID=A0ABT8EXV0_9ACTN|nr:1,4-alpha-glucan branching protein GlgB [Nocardioides abyssi]MDN4162806.1 1,4-alpha-glucan branching protein GlgB [Nocardioides abyssi]